jgi:DNA-binding transcriptional regulator YiaG
MATTKPKQKVAPRSKTFGGPDARERRLASTEAPGERTVKALPKRDVAPASQAKATRAEVKPAGRRSTNLVTEVRAGLGVTREFFARLTGFSVRAIAGWEAGRTVSEAGRRRILEMKRLREMLAEGMRPEFIAQWLETPCEGLGGLKPVEVLERGETDRLWRVALLIGSGMPT